MDIEISNSVLRETTECVEDFRSLSGKPEDLYEVSFPHGPGTKIMLCSEDDPGCNYCEQR